MDMDMDTYIEMEMEMEHVREMGRIPCNGAMKQVPGGVIGTGGMVSKGVQSVWSRR